MKIQIKEQPNYYISDDGKLYNSKGKELFLRNNRDGYVIGYYWKHNKQKVFSIHREVAKAFIPNPDNKPCVNHKDGNKTNNHVDNLEWVTYSENSYHASKHGLLKPKCGEDNGSADISNEQALQICVMLKEGYRKCDIVKIFNVSKDIVANIRNKKTWNHLSKDFDFPTSRSIRYSEETIRWICNLIEQGLGNREIVKLASNDSLSEHQVSKIRSKKVFTEISKEYRF
jgi:hypothetical protein